MTRPNPGGRPIVAPSPATLATAKAMRANKATWDAIAELLGCSRKAAIGLAKREGFYQERAVAGVAHKARGLRIPGMQQAPRPSLLVPAIEDRFRDLWEATAKTREDIAATLAGEFGLKLTPDQLAWHARRRGFNRHAVPQSVEHPAVRFERLLTASWLRDTGPKREDNPVRRVERGTFSVGASGYRMGQC